MDVDPLCRACVSPFYDGGINLLRNPELLALFRRLSTTEINPDDHLPKSICETCYNRLNNFHEFQNMCIASYHDLLDRYAKKLSIPTVKDECIELDEDNYMENDDIGHHNEDEYSNDDNQDIEFDPLNDYDLKLDDPYKHDQALNNEIHSDCRDSESDNEVLANIVRKSKSKQKEKNSMKEDSLGALKPTLNDPSENEIVPKELRKRRRKNTFRTEDNDKKENSEKQHRKKDAYVCDKCPKTFMKREVYEGHMRQHEGLKPFECEQCNKKYSRIERLRNHVLNDHSEKQMRFCCEVEGCDKKYRNRETLKRHVSTHFNPPKPPIDKSERPVFICELCGKQLSTKGVLKEHEMMHKGEFPYACDECPRRFRVSNKLYLHKLRHQGIKNFECKICGLKKTTNKELKSHMNIHTREKQYPCKICNIIFLTNGNLVRHVQVVHDGIKLYACQYCDKAFGKAETLRNHTMKHTGERPLACPHCTRRFISRTSLQYHVKKHEKEDAEGKNAISGTDVKAECQTEHEVDMNHQEQIEQHPPCKSETVNIIVDIS